MGNDKKVASLSCPVDMEITEKERMGIPTEEAVAKQRSLSEKLKEHYKTKNIKKTDVLKSILTPDAINRFAVPIYLFTVASAFKIAFFDVMPLMYAGNDTVVFWQRVFTVFLLFEIMINWLGIRYVDSSYTRNLKMKAKEKEKKDNCPIENVLTSQANNKDTSDSSCAKLLPLNPERSTPDKTQDTAQADFNDENLPKHDDPVESSASKLALEAQEANSAMEYKKEQMKSIADLIKSSEDNKKSHSKKKKSNAVVQDSVKSPTPVLSKAAKTVTYPYWSWVPCFDCNRTRPPRCHHCPLCKTCILKRDHHCFFAGNCVGYRNHHFFYVFLLWAWVCSMYSTIHGFPYIYNNLWEDMSYADVFFPIVILRWMFGYVSFQAALCVTTLSICLYFDMLTSSFIYAHSRLIQWGLTSFEKVYLKRTLEIKDTRKLNEKIRAVFGRNWLLNILFPVSWIYEVEEDPVEWAHIQVIRHKL